MQKMFLFGLMMLAWLKMDTIILNGELWLLNNDGKIPLCGGIPVPKLAGYVKTRPKSVYVVSFG